MTCSIPMFFSRCLSVSAPQLSADIAMATLGPRMLYQLGSLPLKSKLLTRRIETLKLRPLAPWPLQKQKQTQESALLEFDEKVK